MMYVERYFVNQTNNRCVTVGGVKSLLEVSPTHTLLKVPGARIEVTGENLKIARFDETEIVVNGLIQSVITEK